MQISLEACPDCPDCPEQNFDLARMICIWMKDSQHMYEFAPGCKSKERGLSGGLGERELKTLGVKGGVILHEECNLVTEQDRERRLWFLPFWKFCKGLYPEDVGRLTACCQGSWVYVSFLPFGFQRYFWAAQLGEVIRSLPAGGDHYFTCVNSAWECVSFLTMDHILSVTRHPGKSGSFPPRDA